MKKCLVLLACLLVTQHVFAERLTLNYGVNRVDINGDGRRDIVLKIRGETMNAHPFDRYVVSYQDNDGMFYEVPLGDTFRYQFTTHEGADCILRDYQFETDNSGFKIIEFERIFGQSYYDTQPVVVSTYRFVNAHQDNKFLSIGMPPYFLNKQSSFQTEEAYCDVRDVMR